MKHSACVQIENKTALYNFASIATAADGIIISRGNLGLDVAPEKMALVQKDVVSKCNLLGKPVIITRVVDTMATAPPHQVTGSNDSFLCLMDELIHSVRPSFLPSSALMLGRL